MNRMIIGVAIAGIAGASLAAEPMMSAEWTATPTLTN